MRVCVRLCRGPLVLARFVLCASAKGAAVTPRREGQIIATKRSDAFCGKRAIRHDHRPWAATSQEEM